MNTFELIRKARKVLAMKSLLKNQPNHRDHVLFNLRPNPTLRVSDLLSLRVRDLLGKKGKIVGHTSPEITRRYIGIT